MKDLVVVVADKDMQYALRGMLERPQALGIRQIKQDIYSHPLHDPACAQQGVEFMSGFSEQYHYGLLMFDHKGSGREQTHPQELAGAINDDFVRSSWGDRAKVIVLVPELEVWVWNDSPHVGRIAGWEGNSQQLCSWLIEQGYLQEGEAKPARPKKAFEAVLRQSRTPRSSSLYLELARTVSLARCSDVAFLEFKRILQDWFPPL
ncbi:MAG: hypothetical protein F4Z18_11655 [Caldilineaceae bacterium SB0666_bin_21]|nr:hypothetical protein [Caldilineaceae bacterium SB0666_bin_21]